jgi:N-acetylglucosamine-6-phosphate deacetylase
MYAFVNCDVFTSTKVLSNHAVIIDKNKINKIIPYEELDLSIKQIDLNGKNLSPGFIDIQVNGGGGVLFNDEPNINGIKSIINGHKKFGTTKILPTIITDTKEKIQEAIIAVNDYIKNGGNNILGIHIEGPFIESSKAGVHNKKHILKMNNNDIQLLSSLDNGKTLLTVAPEQVSQDLVSKLIDKDILIAIGHTNANANECTNIFNVGATLSTHLYNAMSPLTSREPGAVGSSLINDDVYVSIIVDGFHVDFRSLIPIIRTKPKGKVILVTDAMPPVGSNKNTFFLDPYNIKLENGKCITEDGTLAGSALSMNVAIKNCVQQLGISLTEAFRMASLYPAEFLGLSNKYGKIEEGYIADLVISDNELNIYGIVEEGKYTIN